MARQTIAVIGCGPAGMGFCHAMESIQRIAAATQGNQSSSSSSLDDNISVTCFERSARPGGVWTTASSNNNLEKINMYDALWTNGPSHTIEFSDYTFDEHFGRPVTVYLTRQEVLGYLIGRCTKHCPNFFEKYVKFGQAVELVRYDEENKHFWVTTRQVGAQETVQHKFDKVVWACGDNGKQYIPEGLQTIFKDFQGRFIHSSDTANLQADVAGKRVLLIGGGYSAEDLALQAVKLGANKVYVSTREPDACGLITTAWPENKVEVLREQGPVAFSDGVIQFKQAEWSWEKEYFCPEDAEFSTELRDIDTVICCTGYSYNFDMLSDECLLDVKGNPVFKVPEDWKMPENIMSKYVGDVKPSDEVYYRTGTTRPDLYHGVLVKNPNMMYVCTYSCDFPLLGVDVSAWLLAAFCTGNAKMPSPEEMVRQNQEQALNEIKMPYLRYLMDENYHKALMALDGWYKDVGTYDEAWEEMDNEYTRYKMHQLAQRMEKAGYPFSISTIDQLNENGEAMLEFDLLSDNHRLDITADDMTKQPWKTFRDYENASEFYSLHTGTPAVPLSKPWMDIDSMVNATAEEKKNAY